MNILGMGQELSGLVLLVVTSIRMEDEYKRVSFVPLRIGTHVLIAPLKWHVEQVEYIMFFYRAFVYFVVSIGHNAISLQQTPTPTAANNTSATRPLLPPENVWSREPYRCRWSRALTRRRRQPAHQPLHVPGQNGMLCT